MARDTRQTASFPKRGQLPTSNTLDTAAANLRCAAALLSALYEGGVRHVVISSGSRCAPLVLAAGHHVGLRKWTNPDERSAAFCALGIAKATHKPAALICTSGTAVANYLPAIIEAKMSGTPMVVVTADRPPRLRNVGASQTIDQIDIYGGYVAYSEDLPVSDDANLWR
jgi:2-succinyl-5-enolpyruvyl-6-hydroxy-3-cyclohexene-1-carboxylate synthase